MASTLVPDDLWREIEPLLLPLPPSSSKGGRPPVDNRSALRGIVFCLRSGCPWQYIPTDAFGVGGSSCCRRFHEWTVAGIWPEVHRRLLNRLSKLKAVDLSHIVVDSQSVRAAKGGTTPARTRRIAAKSGANATS